MEDLVSVVVPVYNVDIYLEKCISSIVEQTYSNLEIILVDDGSPDISGEICDRFAQSDKRVSVIHKSNGGLSSARNAGVDFAHGKYIMFVDSDDYIFPDAVKDLYGLIQKNNVKLSIGKCISETEDVNVQTVYREALYQGDEAISNMLYAKDYCTSATERLYLRSLFEGIRYPEGKLFEDLFTTYKLILKASDIAFCSKAVYFYNIHQGSIIFSDFSERKLQVFEAIGEIENNVNTDTPCICSALKAVKLDSVFALLRTKITFKEIKKHNLWKIVKECRASVLHDKNANRRTRGYALVSYCGCYTAVVMTKIYYYLKWR